MKKKKNDYIPREFSDAEIEASVQEFRREVQKEPDDNDEVFPNNVRDIAGWIATLEGKVNLNPTRELKEDLRTYKAFRSGFNKAWQQAVEWFHKEADQAKQEEEEEVKPTMFDGEPLYESEEQMERIVKNMKEDPNTPEFEYVDRGNIKEFKLKPNIPSDYAEKSKWGKKKKGGIKDEKQ